MSLTVTFVHHGVSRTLVKHPTVASKLKHGQITLDEAASKAWFLRFKVDGRERYFKMAQRGKEAVVREARDFLNTRQQKPNEFAAFVAAKDARRGLTIGKLAEEWIAAGLPFSKTKPRSASAADVVHDNFKRCLDWWKDKTVASINTTTHEDYVCHRRATATRGTGSRAADLELSALSCLCQWAVLVGHIEKNPFETRDRYQTAEAVHHCHEFAPKSDGDFHAILRWCWQNQQDTLTCVAGAWLCFTGLVGLRPEEPIALVRTPRLTKPPTDTKSLPPGTIFPMRDGTIKMRIWRNKRGQNPFVTLHPAALEFLNLWAKWLDAHAEAVKTILTEAEAATAGAEGTARWFPGIDENNSTVLNRRITSACADLKLGTIKPKGFGRAYYVRCRRSAGIEDSQIAMELGQTTNGKLIRDTYGDPDDLFGSGLFDWQPDAPETPAWELLRQIPICTALVGPIHRATIAPENVTSPRHVDVTSECVKDTGNMAQDENLISRQNHPSIEAQEITNRLQTGLKNEIPQQKLG